MAYSEKLLHFFHSVAHRGSLTGEGVKQVRIGNTEREVLELYLQCKQGVIKAARFKALGSPALIAAAEYACEYLEGKNNQQALGLSHQQILQALGLSTLYIHIAAMIVNAIKECC